VPVRRSIVVKVKRLVRAPKRPLMMLIPVPELQYTVEMGQVITEEAGSTDGSRGS
jgi:hypothetical protein